MVHVYKWKRTNFCGKRWGKVINNQCGMWNVNSINNEFAYKNGAFMDLEGLLNKIKKNWEIHVEGVLLKVFSPHNQLKAFKKLMIILVSIEIETLKNVCR